MYELIAPFINEIVGGIGILISLAAVYFAGNKSGKSKILVEMEKENVKSAVIAKENLAHITSADDAAYLKQLRDGEG